MDALGAYGSDSSDSSEIQPAPLQQPRTTIASSQTNNKPSRGLPLPQLAKDHMILCDKDYLMPNQEAANALVASGTSGTNRDNNPNSQLPRQQDTETFNKASLKNYTTNNNRLPGQVVFEWETLEQLQQMDHDARSKHYERGA
jgi:hypothetical protein